MVLARFPKCSHVSHGSHGGACRSWASIPVDACWRQADSGTVRYGGQYSLSRSVSLSCSHAPFIALCPRASALRAGSYQAETTILICWPTRDWCSHFGARGRLSTDIRQVGLTLAVPLTMRRHGLLLSVLGHHERSARGELQTQSVITWKNHRPPPGAMHIYTMEAPQSETSYISSTLSSNVSLSPEDGIHRTVFPPHNFP